MNISSSQNSLYCFTTSRGKRDFLKSCNTPLFPKTLTISDFFKRAVFVPDKVLIDSDTRKILLKEACSFANFSDLKIPTDFFKFLENSDSILRLFDELASEFISIEDIEIVDTYAEYDYHLSILKQVINNYRDILESKKLADGFLQKSNYEINRGYINRFDSITIYFEGYPTKYERRVYEEIGKLAKLYLHITLTPFDEKLENTFTDIVLEKNNSYLIDITNKKILEKTALKKPPLISFNVSQNRLEQISLLKEEIVRITEKKIPAENIAVIVPDETFTDVIHSFDLENNFNFAKGFSFENSSIYKLLHAIELYKRDEKSINYERYKELCSKEIEGEYFLENWQKRVPVKEVAEYLRDLLKKTKEDESQKIIEEIFKLEKILKQIEVALLSDIIHLFLKRIKKISYDHKDGGKITVLGILETREAQYDGVVVLDFSDAHAPKQSNKDLFINTAIKKRAGLPSTLDRENYQKSLYYKIFEKAKEISIISTDNDEERPSKFLKSMGLEIEKERRSYRISLINSKPLKRHFQKEIELEIDLTKKPLSNSKFKTYLECKRKFYHKYIEKIKPYEDEKSQRSFKTGDIVHKVLQELFSDKRSFHSFNEMKSAVDVIFEKISEKDIFIKFELAIWRDKIDLFLHREIERFEEGFVVKDLEQRYEKSYEDVILTGVVDRVDIKGEHALVLDYKTGKVESKKPGENTVDFQLLFYYLLLNDKYATLDLGLYDLNKGKILYEEYLEEKLAIFAEKLKGFKERKQNFTLREKKDICRYCDYKLICDR